MPATPETTALEAESQDALTTMEAEAAEFFASRNAEIQSAALNPVAAALDAAEKPVAAPRATSRGKQVAPAAVSPSAKATPNPAGTATPAKIPGAPTLRPIAEKAAAVPDATAAASAEAEPATPDFSDVSREYKPGNTRAPQWEKLHAKADHYEALSVQRHQELEDLRSQLEQVRQQTAAAAPSPEIAQRLQTIQQERDALQAKLEAVAVERSPRFEAQFTPRRNAALAQAKAAVGAEGAAQIEALLAMPESSYRDQQVEALLNDLPPLRATKLTQAVADLDRLTAERQQLASQGSELYKSWTAEESAARERANAERFKKANDTFESELKEWAPVGLTPEEIASARSVYSGQGTTLQDASRAALWAVAGPRAAQMAQDAQARVAELEGELKKLRGAQPGIGAAGGGALPSGAADVEDDPDITSYATRIANQAARAGVRFGV